MSRPDVVLVTPFPPPGVTHAGATGVASYSANLAAALVAEGARVAVMAPRLVPDGEVPTPREPASASALAVYRGFGAGPWAITAALRAARSTGAPVIHLQHELFLWGGAPGIPALVSALGLRGRRPGVVVTMHQVVDPRDVDRAYTRMHQIKAPAVVARTGLANLQRSVARLADRTIVHEVSFARVLERAVVVPHGVEQVQSPDRASSRRALGLDDRFTVLCFGFLAPYKGLELAGAAGALAADRVQVVVAGGDHPRMTGAHGYGGRLRERFDGPVRFTGYVPESDVGHWFAAADLALLPYPRPHSSSGALALAFAHGTPVLISPGLAACIGAPPAMVAAAAPRQLADQLRLYAADPGALDRLRTLSGGLATERSWPVVARRHLELYGEVARAQSLAGRRVRATQPR